jgi:hypothetical protein
MSTTPKVTSKKTPSFITNPIEPESISKAPINNLTTSSIIKAGLMFFATIGVHYLAKTTGIFSYFRQKVKTKNSNAEVMKIKNAKNTLTVRRDLETTKQVNNPSINQVKQIYKVEDRSVKFKKIEVKEFEYLSKVKEKNVTKQISINVKNPIPNQNIAVGKFFNLTIDGTNVFSSNSSIFLETTHTPSWLTSSNPNPTFKGSYNMFYAKKIVVSDNYAYVAVEDIPGLQIIDVSDPTNPMFKGSYDTPNTARGVAISENYAYVVGAGLQVLNISNPANPTLKGSYNITLSLALGITLSGNYAYVVDLYSGLQIIDISNPTNPTFKGPYNKIYAMGVALSENYAYLAARGLRIIDISNSSKPTFKGSCNISGYSEGIALSGNYAYMTGITYDLGNLWIIDISDPANLTFKGSYDTPGNAKEIAFSGNYAYVADGTSGLQIIDISDLTRPKFKSSYDTHSPCSGITVLDNYAYVATENSLQIIDPNLNKVTLLGSPKSIGTYCVNIKACNEEKECATNSFDIIVTNPTITLIIIGSITGTICVASFCCSLIGCGIIILKRRHNKILKDKLNINAERKSEFVQKKSQKFLSEI